MKVNTEDGLIDDLESAGSNGRLVVNYMDPSSTPIS